MPYLLHNAKKYTYKRTYARIHIYDPLDSAEVHNSGYARVFLITVSEWRYIIIRVP